MHDLEETESLLKSLVKRSPVFRDHVFFFLNDLFRQVLLHKGSLGTINFHKSKSQNLFTDLFRLLQIL